MLMEDQDGKLRAEEKDTETAPTKTPLTFFALQSANLVGRTATAAPVHVRKVGFYVRAMSPTTSRKRRWHARL